MGGSALPPWERPEGRGVASAQRIAISAHGLPGMGDGRISSAAMGAARGTWGGLSTVAPPALRFMEAKPPIPAGQ